jgi:phosphoadenosine phosphosulfate reductase
METASAEAVIEWSLETFDPTQIALASSLGVEDQVLTHMLLAQKNTANIFTIDTGRLPQETYDLMQATMSRYGFRYDFLFPEHNAVEEMERAGGPNLFYYSVDDRKRCCAVRKVEPLKRKLATLEAWMCGLRREQSITRSDLHKVEWDAAHNVVKINPLADWTEVQIWDYVKQHKVPYNELHDKGYPSIGCAPCTRAVAAGDDVRSGRWWWEAPEHKECGLHKKREQRKGA